MFFKMNIARELYEQMEEKIFAIKKQNFDFYAEGNQLHKMDRINTEFSELFSQVYQSEFDSSQIEKTDIFQERKEFTVSRKDMYGMCLLYCTFLSAIGIACVLMYKEDYVFVGVLLTPPRSRNNTVISDREKLLRMGENSVVNTGNRSILFEDIYGVLHDTEEKNICYDSDWFADIQEAVCFYTMPEINVITVEQEEFYQNVRLTGLAQDYYRHFPEENKSADVVIDFNNVIFFREEMSRTDCFILGTLNKETGNNIICVETEKEDTQYLLACSLAAENLLKNRRTLIIADNSGAQKIAQKFRNSAFGRYVQFVADGIEKMSDYISEIPPDTQEDNKRDLQQRLATISKGLLRYEYTEEEYGVPLSELLERYAEIGKPLNAAHILSGGQFIDVDYLKYVYRYEEILDKFAKENFDYLIKNPSKDKAERLKVAIKDEQGFYNLALQRKTEVEEAIKNAEHLQELADSVENYSYVAYTLCKKSINSQRNHFHQNPPDNELYRKFYMKYREFLNNRARLQRQMEEFGAEKLVEILDTVYQTGVWREEEETDILLEIKLSTIEEYATLILEQSDGGLKVNSKVQNAEEYFSKLYTRLKSENQDEENISWLDRFFRKKSIDHTELEKLAEITKAFFRLKRLGSTQILTSCIKENRLVSIEELYEFFGENVYGNIFEVQLQSVGGYKELHNPYVFLKEIIRRCADKNDELSDSLFEPMESMVRVTEDLTFKMDDVVRLLSSSPFSIQDTISKKQEIHHYLNRIYELIVRYADKYFSYRENMIQNEMEKFICQTDLTDYQERCLEFERLWCDNNVKFLLEKYQIGKSEYFFDVQYYNNVHNRLKKIYTDQIHKQMYNVAEEKIVVVTEENLTIQQQYFDTCIICNADTITDGTDIGDMLTNCGKLLITYINTEKEESNTTVKQHSQEHNFQTIKYSDYMPVFKGCRV